MPRRHTPPSREVTARTLRDHPALARIIPSLPPRSLTRLYDVVGMNDAGSLMAATPAPLLARALDEAIWSEQDGATRFDPDVFVDWLEVWLGEGEAFTVERLLALDEDTLALYFAAVLRVEDSYAAAFCREPDDGGEPNRAADGLLQLGADTEIFGRFLVSAAVDDEWDIVHGALTALWSEASEQVLALLERLTADDSRPAEEAGHGRLHADAAAARERRREHSGFVPAESARAFLGQARALSAEALMSMADYDLETGRHMRQLEQARNPTGGSADEPETPPADDAAAHPNVRAQGTAGTDNEAGLWRLLARAGVTEAAAPAGLLTGPADSGSALHRHLDALAASDPEALTYLGYELAYLANVLLTGVELPASDRDREADARDLAFATASLGLELLETRATSIELGRPPGLIQAFLIAWRTLSELPPRLVQAFEHAFAAPAAMQQLERKPWLHPQMIESLDDLRAAVRERRIQDGREAIGLLSLVLDTDACRAAVHLLGDPPRFPGLLEGGEKDSARWFRSLRDLTTAGELLRTLAPVA